MPAYFGANVDVTNPLAFQEYAKGAPATVAAYGGRYIARGGAIKVLEGDWAPKRLTIIQFESSAQAKAWFNSPEYRPFKEIRKKAAIAKLLLIEGV